MGLHDIIVHYYKKKKKKKKKKKTSNVEYRALNQGHLNAVQLIIETRNNNTVSFNIY